ncbi:MAG: XRE family transcriptional regulator [Actinomycetota bacterium]|nr:XRE family transcriptional regulator [Actinomycetota bacterium]MDD5666840.1 XRE family transcriptional regulator [Actinomycetota bacterium]
MAKKAEESFGKRIRGLREDKGISIEALSRDIGYPEDFLKDVEEDKVAPPVAVVLQLSRILHVDMEQLQDTRSKEAAKKRTTSHKKRVSSYAYKPMTKPGEKRRLQAYLVTIDAQTEHQGVEYHHEGEEFIYVLQGGLKIQVGQKTSTLKKGGSINFDSSLSHKLSNPTKEKAELLVVIYVP